MLTVPFGAFPVDTGEFLLGDVAVTVVLFESDGSVNPSTEDWTPELIDNESLIESEKGVKQKVRDSLNWWVDTLRNTETGFTHPLNFIIDYTYTDNPVSTGFEPIGRISDEFDLWVSDFLDVAGFNNLPGVHDDVVAFNHSQREKFDADWAFTIFIANSSNNFEDAFLSGGRFRGAFAFAGGRFFVTPSDRPTSTFTHELGHIFYALDEHSSGASFNAERGFFDTQNLNALIGNPDPSFVQAPSIMGSGDVLQDAFDANISSTTSLQMLGWRDSDGDGVFDIIDVPHALSGSGRYDAATGKYLFVGESSVQTLANLNSSGLGNDITINLLSRAQFRLDGAGNPWQDAATLNSHVADLNLSIDVPSTFNSIEIRTIDDRTGITSEVFFGVPSAPTSVVKPGVNGFVRLDANGDGNLTGDLVGLAGWTVRLVDSAGQPIDLTDGVEPDDYAENTVLNQINPQVTLTAIGSGVDNNQVIVRDGTPASTGSKVFRHHLAFGAGVSSTWTANTRKLRIDFASPVTTVSLDAISNSDSTTPVDYGRLEIYDSNDNLLARYTTDGLPAGQVETMTLSRATPDISYAIARGHAGTAIQFDHLQFGPQAEAITDAQGAYSIPYLLGGVYHIELVAPNGGTITTSAVLTRSFAAGQSASNVDFGVLVSPAPWQNAVNPFDVDNNGIVESLDIFKLIDYVRTVGFHEVSLSAPPPMFVDVDGNNQIETLDVFILIDHIRSARSGEGEAAIGSSGNASAAEGEQASFSTLLDQWVLALSSFDAAQNSNLPNQDLALGDSSTSNAISLSSESPGGPVYIASALHADSLSYGSAKRAQARGSFDKTPHLLANIGQSQLSETAIDNLILRASSDFHQTVNTVMTELGLPELGTLEGGGDQWRPFSADPLDTALALGLDDGLLDLLALDQAGAVN